MDKEQAQVRADDFIYELIQHQSNFITSQQFKKGSDLAQFILDFRKALIKGYLSKDY